METVDDIFYEVDDYYINNVRTQWKIKPEILKEFNNSLIPGDVVYFDYRNNISLVELESYLASIGCTRTKKKDLATKIVNNWNVYRSKETINIYYRIETKPTEVPEIFSIRHKSVLWDNLKNLIKKYTDSLRVRIEFDYSQYETLWNLFKSNTIDNFRLAAMSIMTIDWKDNMFLLHMLIYQFQDMIRKGNFSNIPGWSNFANLTKIDWKNHQVYSYQLMRLFKDYEITSEQFQLIHKLLNQ